MNVKFLALFLLLPLFVHAGWIDSYSFDHDLGDGLHTYELYTTQQVELSNGSWRSVTQGINASMNSSGWYFNFSDDGNQRRSFRMPTFGGNCGNYSLTDNFNNWEWGFTCRIPSAGGNSFVGNLSGAWVRRWIGSLGFFFQNKYLDLGGLNLSLGWFNSSLVLTNYSNSVGYNLTWKSNQSGQVEFDPFISNSPTFDTYWEVAPVGKDNSFLKFQLASLPSNVTITYASLNLYFISGGPSTYVMSPIANDTADWTYANSSIQMSKLGQPVGNSTNVSYSYFGNGTHINYWLNWNVTNATQYAYVANRNLTLIINETSMSPLMTQFNSFTYLAVGNGVCTDTDCRWAVNSSRASGANPRLNITFQFNIPQWDSPGYNTTVQGQLTKMFVHWTGNSLGNYFFELDNGNGTNQNYTGAISGIDNWTNYTFYDNQGSNSTVHFRVYQTDSISGGMNVSPLTTFQITPITVKNQPSTVIMLSNTSNETFIYSLMVVIIAVALLLRRKGNSA